jgi:hypothetical protein
VRPYNLKDIKGMEKQAKKVLKQRFPRQRFILGTMLENFGAAGNSGTRFTGTIGSGGNFAIGGRGGYC